MKKLLLSKNRKTKILCLETGGTIASTKSVGGKIPTLSIKDLVETHIASALNIAEFTFPEYGSASHFGDLLDSSNMQPANWVQLATLIFKSFDEDYDAVLITLGTDTLAYTASALSLMVQHPIRPIVFTGAQKTISEESSDIPTNFLDATLACALLKPGFYVVFGGRIIDARLASKVSSTNVDAFHTLNGKDFGKVHQTSGLIEVENYTRRHHGYRVILNTNFDPLVKVETLTPGYEPAWLYNVLKQENVHGVIIAAFGLGGVPQDSSLSLINAIKEYAPKKPIVICTQCHQGGVALEEYAVGKTALEAGVISAGKYGIEYTSNLLKWILGQTRSVEQIKDLWSKLTI
jgi:L-asparaginase